jgi:hypothetical protein
VTTGFVDIVVGNERCPSTAGSTIRDLLDRNGSIYKRLVEA